MGQFDELASLSADEVVTHAYVRDVPLPSGSTLALITLDNGRDHTRPSTFGPVGLLELDGVLDAQKARAAAGEIKGLAITGKPFILAAGADLSKVGEIPSRAIGKQLAQLGHHVFGKLSGFGVPTFVFINGLALGGGLEIGLNSDYRTVDPHGRRSRAARGLPGHHPGLGRRVAATEPDRHRERAEGRHRESPSQQHDAEGPAGLRIRNRRRDLRLGQLHRGLAIVWADGVITGKTKVKRPNEPGKIERAVKWDIAIGIAQKSLESRIGTIAKSPYKALELLKAAKNTDKKTGFAAEDDALSELIAGDQFPRIHLRLRSRAEAGQAAGRRPGQGDRQEGHQGRRHRRGTHGISVRAAVRAPAEGAGGHHRPRPGARR